MNFISLTFVFLFPVVVLLYWKIPWKHRELFSAGSELLFLYTGKFLGGRAASAYNGGYLSGGNCYRKRQTQKNLADFCCGCVPGTSDRTEIFGPASGNLILYFPDNGIRDRCISGRDFCGKKSCKLCSVCFILSTAGGRPDREGGESPRTAEGKTYKEPGRSAEWFLADAPGILQKVVVADYLAVYVDRVYAAPQDAGGIGAVLGTVFFAVQIYCDFSGYTDIARGAARMMGIRLMKISGILTVQ